jgi:hypothetical protein
MGPMDVSETRVFPIALQTIKAQMYLAALTDDALRHIVNLLGDWDGICGQCERCPSENLKKREQRIVAQ